jgi:hypothetical protein
MGNSVSSAANPSVNEVSLFVVTLATDAASVNHAQQFPTVAKHVSQPSIQHSQTHS